MFIVELLIYILFAWIMYSFAKKSEGNSEEGVIDQNLWYFILFFSLIAAIRWRVGRDSESYILVLRDGLVREDSREFLWDWLVLTIKNWGFHFSIGMGLMAFGQIFFLTDTLKRYKYILIWLPVVLFGGRYFGDLMNGVRQFFVACAFVYLSRYITDRKPVYYVAGILLCTGIHSSAIILLPFYLLTYVKISEWELPDKRYLNLAILGICFILGQSSTFGNIAGYIEPVLSFSGYDRLTEGYTHALAGNSAESLSLGPIMISWLLIGILTIWYGPKLSEYYKDTIPYFDLWYFFSLVYTCGFFLVCNLGHMMIRPIQYFEFFQVIILSMLLALFKADQEQYSKALYITVFIIWICIAIGIYKNMGTVFDTVTYKTILFHT